LRPTRLPIPPAGHAVLLFRQCKYRANTYISKDFFTAKSKLSDY